MPTAEALETTEDRELTLALERSVIVHEEAEPLAASIGLMRGLFGSTVLWIAGIVGFLYFG